MVFYRYESEFRTRGGAAMIMHSDKTEWAELARRGARMELWRWDSGLARLKTLPKQSYFWSLQTLLTFWAL